MNPIGNMFAGLNASSIIRETPINTPEVSCGHCTKTVPINEAIVCTADGRLFCSVNCRAAAEVFDEWTG